MIDTVVRLEQLRAGQKGRIRRIEGETDQVHRLKEFGLSGGVRIQVFRSGNPCIIQMAGSKVCIRADRSVSVLVEPDEAGD